VSIAYKGGWIRRTRTFAFAKDDRVAMANAWFEGLSRELGSGKQIARHLASAAGTLPDAALTSWTVESCISSYPLSVVASSRLPEQAVPVKNNFLVLTIELALDSGPWIASAPIFIGALAI
jgi:hypothetical protein